MRIAFHPAFDDAAALADQYWRAAHYLGAVGDAVDVITFRTNLPAPVAPPAYLDQSLPARSGEFVRKVRFEGPSAQLSPHDLVIVWKAERRRDAPEAAEHVVLDSSMLHEGDLWIELGARLTPVSADARAKAHARLVGAFDAAQAPIANLFGSGPSLGAIDWAALPPGVNIVCNSLVTNLDYMARIRPAFIVAVDPIFHAGCSRHAGVFREKLVTALRGSDAWFVAQERDAHLYHAALPEDVRERVIPVPTRFGLTPNLDMRRRFCFAATRNVLTLAMLPLAAHLAREVRCYGFDGRAESERETFWAYDPSVALTEELALQRQAHPGFFSLDYQDYYALHCGTVEAWIAAMARRGVNVRSATPSHIPALAARGLPGIAPASAPSRGFTREIARTYARRQAQAVYGAVLESGWAPAWAKRALRGIVRVGKRNVLSRGAR